MRMSLSLLFSLLISLVACQKTEKIIIERDTSGRGESPLQIGDLEYGGIDGGGGNGIEGKPLESYQISLADIEEFDTHIIPMIESLKRSFPELASDMVYLSKERLWYFVPVALNKIPSFKIGTFFQTDQIAIQSRSEIWVDERLYLKMDTESRVQLLVHELLMGVKILEASSSLEKCFVEGALLESEKAYKAHRSSCMGRYSVNSDLNGLFKSDSVLKISEDDYAFIRRLTMTLLDSQEEIDSEDLKDRMEISGFRVY